MIDSIYSSYKIESNTVWIILKVDCVILVDKKWPHNLSWYPKIQMYFNPHKLIYEWQLRVKIYQYLKHDKQ